jgi:predicted  nucleic acid-binding Zn-ribbon protein
VEFRQSLPNLAKINSKQMENLSRLLDYIKTIRFFDRLFKWNKVKNLLIDSAYDLQRLNSNIDNQKDLISKLENESSFLKKDLKIAEYMNIRNEATIKNLESSIQENNNKIEKLVGDYRGVLSKVETQGEQINSLIGDNRVLTEKNTSLIAGNKKLSEEAATNSENISSLLKRKGELENNLAELKKELQMTVNELNDTNRRNAQLLKDEEFRKQEHSNSLASLEKIQDQIQNERTKEVQERNNAEIERLKNLKETWKKHQDTAKSIIKAICQKHTVEYVETVPFKGDPDNAILICDEYVVLDAKSPGGDTLSNFSGYLKDQAEKARKYAKQADVKTDIFFIVPSNTLDHISTFVYRHGDHNVYIISIDALEPVILSLKKIEEYEFVDQLSPEDRESICRILGRFAHLSKRRIQVDSFFAKQFIELAYKCETDLQPDILKSVVEFEKSEKLNPPIEKRAKSIPLVELENESKKINQEAGIRGVLIQDENISNLLNELPLYKSTDEQASIN